MALNDKYTLKKKKKLLGTPSCVYKSVNCTENNDAARM